MGQRKPSKLLSDYRWVFSHDARSDTTPALKILRKLLVKAPTAFLSQMSKLEAELAGKKVVAGENKGPVQEGLKELADPGGERVLELIDQLLNDWETSKQ